MSYEEFLHRIENKLSFTEEENRDFFYGDLLSDEDLDIHQERYEYGEIRRWSHYDTVIWRIGDRYFSISGDIGSTEYQDDCFYDDPFEVRPIEEIMTVTVTNYLPVKD